MEGRKIFSGDFTTALFFAWPEMAKDSRRYIAQCKERALHMNRAYLRDKTLPLCGFLKH